MTTIGVPGEMGHVATTEFLGRIPELCQKEYGSTWRRVSGDSDVHNGAGRF